MAQRSVIARVHLPVSLRVEEATVNIAEDPLMPSSVFAFSFFCSLSSSSYSRNLGSQGKI